LPDIHDEIREIFSIGPSKPRSASTLCLYNSITLATGYKLHTGSTYCYNSSKMVVKSESNCQVTQTQAHSDHVVISGCWWWLS